MAAVVVLAGANAGCRDTDSTADLAELVKLTPVAVDGGGADAWQLFDRSTRSGFAPANGERLAIALGADSELAGIKVFGASPYVAEVYASGERVAELDLSDASGWTRYPVEESIDVRSVEIVLRSTGPITPIAELELWGRSGDSTKTIDDAAVFAAANGNESNRLATVAAPLRSSVSLVAGERCSRVPFSLSRHPATFDRAWLSYDTNGVFRPFVLQRSVNGSVAIGGTWIPNGDTTASFVDEIDPGRLNLGSNELMLCVPQTADGTVHFPTYGSLRRSTMDTVSCLAPERVALSKT